MSGNPTQTMQTIKKAEKFGLVVFGVSIDEILKRCFFRSFLCGMITKEVTNRKFWETGNTERETATIQIYWRSANFMQVHHL
jgi:hypothetical protein